MLKQTVQQLFAQFHCSTFRVMQMQDASAMFLEAVELMEDEGQETMALDMFRQAIGMTPSSCTSDSDSSCLFLL